MPDPTVLVVRDTWTEAGVTSNEKQREFWQLCEEPGSTRETVGVDEILFSGSIRAGKSQACAKKQVRWAWEYPGTQHLAVRRTYPQLRDSTKMIYLRGDGGMPPALPAELIKQERVGDEEVHLKNGSKILFRSAEDPLEAMKNIRNVTLASVFIDQIEELDRILDPELYETYLSRLSDPRGPNKMIAAANPGPTDHFAYLRYHPDSDQREPQTRFVNVTIYDNEHNLNPGYVKRLERRGKRDPIWFDRYCLGKWGAFGGKRFKTWNPQIHVIRPFRVPQSWEVVGGMDYGWDADTRYILLVVDPADRYYAVGEYAANETPPRGLAKGVRDLERDLNLPPSIRWLDPSTWATRDDKPSVAEQLIEHGLDVGKADNDRIGGWARIDDLLQEEVDGDPHVAGDPEESRVPRLRFFEGRLPMLMKELPNAKIKDGTEDIEKKNDHSLDALRYIVNGRPPVPLEDDEEEESDPRERYARKRIARAFAEDDEEVVTY